MAIMTKDVGIDLGTTNTSVYVKGRGVVVSEPSILVISKDDPRKIRAVGDEAAFLLGRATDELIMVEPISNGKIINLSMAKMLIQYFLRKAVGASFLSPPTVIVSAPCGLDDVERKALVETVRQAGAKHVHIVYKPFLAGIGSGLPVYDAIGSMVVDIGGGTTDGSVLSLGGSVVSQSIRMGGRQIDQAIIDYMAHNYEMSISRQTAESIKMDLASAMKMRDEEVRKVIVRGRDRQNPRAMSVSLTSNQVFEAIREPCKAIVSSIKWVLSRTPPELSADILRTGIHLTGGAAQLFALDRYISNELGIPVLLAKDAADCTVLGLGYLTENIQLVTDADKDRS